MLAFPESPENDFKIFKSAPGKILPDKSEHGLIFGSNTYLRN